MQVIEEVQSVEPGEPGEDASEGPPGEYASEGPHEKGVLKRKATCKDAEDKARRSLRIFIPEIQLLKSQSEGDRTAYLIPGRDASAGFGTMNCLLFPFLLFVLPAIRP